MRNRIDILDMDIIWNGQGDRSVVKNCADASSYQSITNTLRYRGGDCNHGDLRIMLANNVGDTRRLNDLQTIIASPDFLGVVIEDRHYSETPFDKASVVRDGPSKIARTHYDDRPFAVYL